MTDAPAPDKPKAPALAVLFTVVFINLVGFGLIVPLLPFFGSSLGADEWQVMRSHAEIGAGFPHPAAQGRQMGGNGGIGVPVGKAAVKVAE